MTYIIDFCKQNNVDNLSTTNIQVEHLQTIATRLKEQQPTLDMSMYLSKMDRQHLCATSCCVAGWGLEWQIGSDSRMDDNWKHAKQHNLSSAIAYEYALTLLGHDLNNEDSTPFTDAMFLWVFGGCWSNSLDHAIERLTYLAEHKSAPAFLKHEYLGRAIHFTSISLLDLLNQLPKSMYVREIDYTELPKHYTLIDVELCTVIGNKRITSTILNHTNPNNYEASDAILLHDDDIKTFNTLTTDVVIVKKT